MSDIDEKKPTGKAGKRKKHADQRSRKSDQKPRPKTDQPRSDPAPIDPVLSAATETAAIPAEAVRTQPSPVIAAVEPVPIALVPIAVHANEMQADTAILAAEAVAAQDVSAPSAHTMPSVTAPVATQDVREPPAALTTSVDMAPVDMAPVAKPKLGDQTVAPTATQMSVEAAPVPAADVSVCLQTIAQAYGEYTRKSLEQTKCFFDKLTGVRSLEQAVEIQTEFAKQACQTFVAEAQKIHELHRELARQRFQRLEGLMTVGAQAS